MNVEVLTNDQAELDAAFSVEVKAYADGKQIIPTSATVAVYNPDGDEVLAATAMSVSALGTMTYAVSATLIDELWESALLKVAYIYGGTTYNVPFLFDVVIYPLRCTVTDADLKAHAPQIAEKLWANPGDPDTYQAQISEAFALVKRALKDKGRRPAMILDGSQIRELVIYKTFELITLDFAKSPEDIWWARYLKYAEAYKTAFDSLRIKYDEDESGAIDSDDEDATLGQITLVR